LSNNRKAKALILRATKYGEADLIVQVLTSEGEKLSLLARSALKSKKRFGGGVLEPTHYVQLQFRQNSSRERMSTLEDAQIIDAFPSLRLSYDRVEAALFVVQCLARASQEGDSLSVDLFNLGGHSLKSLESVQDLTSFKIHFCLKLLFQQGVLETESWMKTYLQTSMAHHSNLEKNEDLQKDLHWIWVQSRLKEYLSTGNLSN